MTRPTLAVWKLASCDGCQLTLLDCEDELLAIADAVDIAVFAEATTRVAPGPYDLSLVEGSIATAHDAERIRAIRGQSRALVTIGACATAGGIQALRNLRDHGAMMAAVYARPAYLDSLATSTPIAAHVAVDLELRGCPIDKRQLLEVITAYVHGRRPRLASHPTCVDCKLAGHVCVMVARGEPCLGPVTHAGCGALCPGYARGCFGCFGPSDAPRAAPLADRLVALGGSRAEVARRFATFNAAAPAFAEGAARAAGEPGEGP
jgi:coenzyme F420-reducing hydrogenase gamma subunit